jgi:hypothetical protein
MLLRLRPLSDRRIAVRRDHLSLLDLSPDHGRAVRLGFTVSERDFSVTAGAPTRFSSSEHGTRSFCTRCGTQLTFQSSRAPGQLDVTTCSLDDPERVPPRDHTRTSSQLSWIELADGLPWFPEARD